MSTRFEIDFGRVDYPALTPGDRDRIRRWAAQRAQAERTEATRKLAGGVAATARGGASAAAGWWKGWLDRRRRRLAAAELNAVDDDALKDIGVARCEIDRLVATGLRDA